MENINEPKVEKDSQKVNTAVQNTDQPKGKSKGCLIAIIIVLVIIVLLSVGVFLIGKIFASKAKNALESAVSAGTGGRVSLDTDKGAFRVSENGQTLEVGTKNSWPSDMPSDVPKYSKGEIQTASTFDNAKSKTWAVMISKADEASYKSYSDSLSSSGWSKEEMPTGIVNINQFKKNDLTLTLTFDSSSKGVNLTVLKDLK